MRSRRSAPAAMAHFLSTGSTSTTYRLTHCKMLSCNSKTRQKSRSFGTIRMPRPTSFPRQTSCRRILARVTAVTATATAAPPIQKPSIRIRTQIRKDPNSTTSVRLHWPKTSRPRRHMSTSSVLKCARTGSCTASANTETR